MLAKITPAKSHNEQKAIRRNDFIYHSYCSLCFVELFNNYEWIQFAWKNAPSSQRRANWLKTGSEWRKGKTIHREALNELHELTCLMMGKKRHKAKEKSTQLILTRESHTHIESAYKAFYYAPFFRRKQIPIRWDQNTFLGFNSLSNPFYYSLWFFSLLFRFSALSRGFACVCKRLFNGVSRVWQQKKIISSEFIRSRVYVCGGWSK